ncbi:hypothetical protein L1987_70727 [Smallanthus sonchifolius]|uniref:Uncharacterized protein n=1 Tax=Smallanthus sonchifolius TaxID=185202 RepID=A0ACB9AR39_9ASTR|nr:hypothetical protein L1987_70727 [Smallanthus sonchifolius]
MVVCSDQRNSGDGSPRSDGYEGDVAAATRGWRVRVERGGSFVLAGECLPDKDGGGHHGGCSEVVRVH